MLKVMVYRTRQRREWLRWNGKQGQVQWAPRHWWERSKTVVPESWQTLVRIEGVTKVQGKYISGGGKKLWSKIRERVVGRQWWGCVPRLSAADMMLLLKIQGISMEVIARPQVVGWMEMKPEQKWVIVNMGNHWALLQRVGLKKGIIWDTYGIADKPSQVGQAMREILKEGVDMKCVSTGVQSGNNDRTCGYTVLRWAEIIQKMGTLKRAYVSQEGEVEFVVRALDKLHNKTGRRRMYRVGYKVKSHAQVQRYKAGFLTRKRVGMVSSRQTELMYEE